jgi:dTDP-4-dehydrorhamnose 3,5-epimerase
MRLSLHPTAVAGAYLVESPVFHDARGSFTTVFEAHEAAALGLAFPVVQCQIARNRRAHTLRGLHYQAPPSAQAKLVRCIRGRIWDVAVDLRPDSPTFRRWAAVELAEDTDRAFYIPAGCAHGYLTLADDSDILYLVDNIYDPARERGVRWNDPAFAIAWPAAPAVIAERDATFPDFVPTDARGEWPNPRA